MRKKLHQITALMLAFILILTSVNIPEVSAAEKSGSYITVSKNIYCITKVSSGAKSGEVVLMKWGSPKTTASVKEKITYKKNVYKVVGIAGAYKGKKKAKSVFGASVKKVTLPNTITLIGENAFNGCKKLTSLTIPESVKKIEKKAVNNCPALKKITLKSRDITFPASGAFAKASKKAVVYIPTGLTTKDTYRIKVKKQLTAGGQVKYNLSKPEVKAIEKGELLKNKSVQENEITLKGVSFSNQKIKKVTYQITDESNKKIASGSCKGTTSWTLSCALKDGTNAIKITAEDSSEKKGSSTVYVVKVDKQVAYSEDVKVESIETSQEAAESITDIARQGDFVSITVKNDSEILSYVENGTLKKGDVYFLQPSDEMPTGFAGIFEGVRDDQGENVIQFTPATLEDVYKDDVTIDLSGEIDSENPVACAYLPDGTKIDVAGNGNQMKSLEHAKLNAKTSGPLSLFDNITLSKKNGAYELEIGFDDILLYDGDGNDKTKNDQLKLHGSYTISDFRSDFYFANKGLSIKQCYSKTSYEGKSDIQLKFGANLSTKKMVEDLNGGFKNKRKLLFVDLEGIDLSDSIMLGVVGINMTTLTPLVSTFQTIQKTSEMAPFSPVAFVSFILHLDGTISAQVTAGYNETSYNEKGFNLQKKGFVGKYGAFDPSLGKSTKVAGYNFQKIDRTGKNKTDMSGTSERLLYLEGEGKASVEIGAGILGAIMIGGIIPAGFSAYPYYKADGQIKGRLEIELPMEGIDATGEYKLKQEIGVAGKVAYSLTKNFKNSWELKKVFWSKTIEGKAGADDGKEPEQPDDQTDTGEPEELGKSDDTNALPAKEFDPMKVPYTISAGQTCTFESVGNDHLWAVWGYQLCKVGPAIFEIIQMNTNGKVKQELNIDGSMYTDIMRMGVSNKFDDKVYFDGNVSGKSIIKVYFGKVEIYSFHSNKYVRNKITAKIESGGKTVKNPLVLNKEKITLKVGDTFQIKAKSGMPEYELKSVTYNPEYSYYRIADVDENGKIKALRKGKKKITVTGNGGFQKVCTVTVK